MEFLEEEQRIVDANLLALEDTVLYDLELKEDNSDNQNRPRPVPENFKSIRA